jgi:hypothetical protein
MASISLNYKKFDSCKQILSKTLQKVVFFWSVTPCSLVKFTGVLKGRTTPVLMVEGRWCFRETLVNISTAIRRLTSEACSPHSQSCYNLRTRKILQFYWGEGGEICSKMTDVGLLISFGKVECPG